MGLPESLRSPPRATEPEERHKHSSLGFPEAFSFPASLTTAKSGTVSGVLLAGCHRARPAMRCGRRTAKGRPAGARVWPMPPAGRPRGLIVTGTPARTLGRSADLALSHGPPQRDGTRGHRQVTQTWASSASSWCWRHSRQLRINSPTAGSCTHSPTVLTAVPGPQTISWDTGPQGSTLGHCQLCLTVQLAITRQCQKRLRTAPRPNAHTQVTCSWPLTQPHSRAPFLWCVILKMGWEREPSGAPGDFACEPGHAQRRHKLAILTGLF